MNPLAKAILDELTAEYVLFDWKMMMDQCKRITKAM